MESKKRTSKNKNATPKREKLIRNKPEKRKRENSESNSEKFSDEQNLNRTDKTDLNDISLDDDHGKFKKYNKDKQWKLDQIPHHLLPSFNFTVDTDINNVRDYPLLKISLPHSVFVSSSQVNDVDICHRRTTALAAYMHHLKKLRTAYLSAKKRSKQIRKDEASGIYYHTFVTFAEMRDKNPDKYFARDYDFYYTSGNLCSIENTNQILHVSGPHLEKLILSRFSAEPEVPNVEKIAEFDFIDGSNENSEIFEVQFSEYDNNSFYSRQKFSIALHQYMDDKIFTVKNFKSRTVPFISFAQDKFNKNHLSISTLQHQLRLYDLESDKALQKFQLVPKDEIKPALTWNIVRSWTSQVYIYVSCKKINIIDTRAPQREWQSNYCGYTEDNYCSNFCSLSLSGFDNLFYVASNHKLYCVDKRSMGKNIESKSTAVARWTHQMSSFPLMLATSRNKDCEYIALQSPLSSDLRICENLQYYAEYEFTTEPLTEFSSEYVYKAPCLPYMPMSLENVFQEARKLGKCIKPGTGISNRIKSCCTGLSFVGHSSNPYIFTATSRGDIFARQMYSSNIENLKVDQISPADAMCRYEENIFRSVRKPPLNVTDICDLSGISKVFRCPELSGIRPFDDDLGIPSKRRYMGRWQKSVQSLFKYKDALAADLLSVWDVEEEDDNDFNLEALTKNTENDSNSVVRGWLTNAHDVPHSTMLSMTSIPSDVFMLSNAGLETLLEETIKNESQDEQPELLATPKLKVAKKKSRYVKGF